MRATNDLQRLEEREIELVDAMSRGDAIGFTLARTGGGNLRSLLVEQRRAEQDKAACEEKFKSVAARTVCVERLHLAVMRAERREVEKKTLEELIEQEWSRTTSLK